MLKITSVKFVPPHRDDERTARVKKLVISIWPKEETVLDNLENRFSRPYVEWKKLLPEAIKQVATDLSVTPEYAQEAVKDAKWSQKAGCNCGCSPGFVIPGIFTKGSMHVDIAEG